MEPIREIRQVAREIDTEDSNDSRGHVRRLTAAVEALPEWESEARTQRAEARNLRATLSEQSKRIEELEARVSEHVWHPDYDEEQGRVIDHCFNCNAPRECHPPSGAASPQEPTHELGAVQPDIADETRRGSTPRSQPVEPTLAGVPTSAGQSDQEAAPTQEPTHREEQ